MKSFNFLSLSSTNILYLPLRYIEMGLEDIDEKWLLQIKKSVI